MTDRSSISATNRSPPPRAAPLLRVEHRVQRCRGDAAPTLAQRGKSILFTDRASWSDDEIVRANRSQHHIEAAFERMKDPHFVSWRLMFHWTDQKIRVHAFSCVLALLLTALLRRGLAQRGLVLSTSTTLQTLAGIKEVAVLYPGARSQPVITYSRLTRLQAQLVTALNLDRFHAAQGIHDAARKCNGHRRLA